MPDGAAVITPDRRLHPPEASSRTAATICALGLGFDLAFNGQRPGVSIPLFVVAVIATLRPALRRSIETDTLLAAAAVFAVFPAVRASEGLIALDLLAVSALLFLAATQDLGGLALIGISGLIGRGVAIGRRTLAFPRFLAAPLVGRRPLSPRWRSLLRLLAISIPVFTVFVVLLASGDRVFGDLLVDAFPSWNVGHVASHVLLIGVGTILLAVLWRVAAGGDKAPQVPDRRRREGLFSPAEWMTVLVGLNVLFGAFVVVQLAYLFGGSDRVVVTPGLTYAEYARSGFFQLAVAAALSMLVILGAWDFGGRHTPNDHAIFKLLVSLMVALDGVVLGSALMRLALYEGRFGFTTKRFVGYFAIGAIGVFLLVLLAGIWSDRREQLVATFIATILVALLVANIMNPERFVAARNVARFDATGRIDAAYLGWALGADAIPVTAQLLRRVSAADAAALSAGLCAHAEELDGESGWRSANLGRAAAAEALRAAGAKQNACNTERPLPGVSG